MPASQSRFFLGFRATCELHGALDVHLYAYVQTVVALMDRRLAEIAEEARPEALVPPAPETLIAV